MMKKKAKEQEEPNKGNNKQTTDSKEHTEAASINTGMEPENAAKGPDTAPEGVAKDEGATTADKVVSQEPSAEEKLAEMQEKYLRLSAEFDNYRKRTLREKMELSKYAAEEIFRKLIPVMDDFDRAIVHMASATDCAAMKDGIDLIYNKFSEFLKQNGIKEIESMNIGFNVDLHDAVAKVQVEETDRKGKIVDVVQKGYYLQDKVLRHSKVVVGE